MSENKEEPNSDSEQIELNHNETASSSMRVPL